MCAARWCSFLEMCSFAGHLLLSTWPCRINSCRLLESPSYSDMSFFYYILSISSCIWVMFTHNSIEFVLNSQNTFEMIQETIVQISGCLGLPSGCSCIFMDSLSLWDRPIFQHLHYGDYACPRWRSVLLECFPSLCFSHSTYMISRARLHNCKISAIGISAVVNIFYLPCWHWRYSSSCCVVIGLYWVPY